MSKIEELIAKYCPDGVEYVAFFDVCDFIRGITYNKNQEAKDSHNAHKVLRANNITLHHNTLNFEDVKLVSSDVVVKTSQQLYAGDILMCAGSGSKEHVGKVAYIKEDIDYTFGGFMSVVRCKSCIIPRFMFHILTGDIFSKHLEREINSTTINNINKQVMQSLEIPLPPLPVQEEIVRILDTFTELQAELQVELQVELQARQQQYQYYRDNLLSFEGRTDVEEYTLGELFEFKNGLNASKEQFGHGKPIVNYVNVYKKNHITSADLTGRVELDASSIDRYRVKRGDVFFTRTSETKEEIGMASVLLENVEDCVFSGFVLRARPTTDILLPNFCKYCFAIYDVRKQIIQSSTLTTRALTNGTSLSKVKIKVPPLAEQQKIVDILDRFDTLVNDLSQGLPAEIEARRQQYEYYRDKLLTFKRKA